MQTRKSFPTGGLKIKLIKKREGRLSDMPAKWIMFSRQPHPAACSRDWDWMVTMQRAVGKKRVCEIWQVFGGFIPTAETLGFCLAFRQLLSGVGGNCSPKRCRF